MNAKPLIIAFSILIPSIVIAGPVEKMTPEEKQAYSDLTRNHVLHKIRQPADGCYDIEGTINKEGAVTSLEGFSFTCISKPSKLPEGELAELRQLAIESGAAIPIEKVFVWFPKRAADYCAEHFEGDLKGCIKVLDAD